MHKYGSFDHDSFLILMTASIFTSIVDRKSTHRNQTTNSVYRELLFEVVVYIGTSKLGTTAHVWYRTDSGIEGVQLKEVLLYIVS